MAHETKPLDQQSTPLSAEAEAFLAETFDNHWMMRPVEECRSRLAALLDAARERPSALDVETLARAHCDHHFDSCDSQPWHRREAERILARLTEPDAGEGTGWREASRRLHESGDDEPYATDTPDTTEATPLPSDAGPYYGPVVRTTPWRDVRVDHAEHTHATPDTTEALCGAILSCSKTSGHTEEEHERADGIVWHWHETVVPHRSDTTEARVEYQRGYSDGFRQLFEDMTAARLSADTTEATLPWERPTEHVQTPEGPDDYCTGCGELWPCSFEQGRQSVADTTEATLRAAAEELVQRSRTKPSHRPADQPSYEGWIKDGIARLAAALQQPAVQHGDRLVRIHGGRHLLDDTREDCPECWAAAGAERHGYAAVQPEGGRE